MKIAVLYICTGKYSIFWEPFYRSCEKYFLPENEKHYFVFSDTVNEEIHQKIFVIHQEKLGWPYDTLMRFHFFDQIKEKLKEYDYIFFFNANVIFQKKVDENILIIDGLPAELIVVKHPFFDWVKYPRNYPYDRNRKSTAFIPFKKGFMYAFGAVNGGNAESYLEMVEFLKANIDRDLNKNIIPIWHDESQLNKHVLTTKRRVKILNYNFGFPEGHDLPLKNDVFILVKDKTNFGGHDFLREKENSIPKQKEISSSLSGFQRIKKMIGLR